MNRAELYGDGFFETIRIQNKKPLLWDLHLKRIQSALNLLKFENKYFSILQFSEEVLSELQKYDLDNCRCRISFFRTGDGYYTPQNASFEYKIEISILNETAKENQMKIGIYPEGVKAKTPFASIKSNNALLFVLAGIYAKEQQWNDILILNQYNRIAEGLASNIFIVKDKKIYTPPLSELCVDGVMRSYILSNFANSFNITEKEISIDDLLTSNEIWLTNAINGIRWISSFNGKSFEHNLANEIDQQIKNALKNS